MTPSMLRRSMLFVEYGIALTLLIVAVFFLFIAELAGSRIVMWRHISPYPLSLTYFGSGILLLSSSQDEKWAAD